MTRRVNRLLFIALTVITVTLYFGCSQPEDIVSPVSLTTLTLSAQQLPAVPDGMMYELWVAKVVNVNIPGEDDDTVFTSLGKFDYDLRNRTFFDSAGNPRVEGSVFNLEGDIFSYDFVAVSVDVNPDTSLDPGSIMLIDAITDPDNDPVEMRFPLSDSMWFATCRFNMQTVSDTMTCYRHFTSQLDTTIGGTDTTIDVPDSAAYSCDQVRSNYIGSGLWFCSYQIINTQIVDTTVYDSFTIDSTWLNDIGNNTETTAVVNILNPRIETIELILGLDTFFHESFQYEIVAEKFTEAPFLTTEIHFFIEEAPGYSVTYDQFNQDDFALWDYSGLGWHYKGWIVAPSVTNGGASVGSFTMPSWGNTETGKDKLPGYQGGMLSTGTFNKIDEPDDDYAYYGLSSRIPPFPGDEFFVDLPNNATDTLDLLAGANIGTIFISLEPDNFVTDTTNFPLLPFIGYFPDGNLNLGNVDDEITMDNLTQTNDPYNGFPIIFVEIKRY